MEIQRDNLLIALHIVIERESVREREELGYFSDSAFLAGMKQAYVAVMNGEQLILRD